MYTYEWLQYNSYTQLKYTHALLGAAILQYHQTTGESWSLENLYGDTPFFTYTKTYTREGYM